MELEKGATKIVIKLAYRKMILKYHPDRNPDDPEALEKARGIIQAYEYLAEERIEDVMDEIFSEGEH